MDIWNRCEGHEKIVKMKLEAWRVVEDQSTSSTRPLVDSLEEHEILEQEIEGCKPPITLDCQGLDYLLFTPFRYPPLKYGSRFGKKTDPSLWYGSCQLTTALAEKAYYRFVFTLGSEKRGVTDRISKTAFSVKIDSSRGIDLTTTPFLQYRELISSPTAWKVGQALGARMRESHIQAFKYFSSRANDGVATNVGVLSSTAFANKKPHLYTHFIEFSSRSTVEFLDRDNQESYVFRIEDFMIEEKFPFPPD